MRQHVTSPCAWVQGDARGGNAGPGVAAAGARKHAGPRGRRDLDAGGRGPRGLAHPRREPDRARFDADLDAEGRSMRWVWCGPVGQLDGGEPPRRRPQEHAGGHHARWRPAGCSGWLERTAADTSAQPVPAARAHVAPCGAAARPRGPRGAGAATRRRPARRRRGAARARRQLAAASCRVAAVEHPGGLQQRPRCRRCAAPPRGLDAARPAPAHTPAWRRSRRPIGVLDHRVTLASRPAGCAVRDGLVPREAQAPGQRGPGCTVRVASRTRSWVRRGAARWRPRSVSRLRRRAGRARCCGRGAAPCRRDDLPGAGAGARVVRPVARAGRAAPVAARRPAGSAR